MAEEKSLALAKDAYNTVIETFKQQNWGYEERSDGLSVTCRAKGEDLPMEFLIVVDPDHTRVTMMSQLPFDVPDDEQIDMAVATTIINYDLVAGCFLYNINSNKVYFRIENSYLGSPLNTDIILYMINASISMVDDYNDKLYMLATHMIDIDKFADSVKGGN